MASSFKKKKRKFDLSADINMLDYDKNKESPYLQYCDVNNLYEWEMSQKLPLNNF